MLPSGHKARKYDRSKARNSEKWLASAPWAQGRKAGCFGRIAIRRVVWDGSSDPRQFMRANELRCHRKHRREEAIDERKKGAKVLIKAIIFDFDGTVIDTETVWYRAFREAFEAYGVDLTVEMYAPCIGTGYQAFNPFEYLATDLHLPIDLKAFRSSVEARHAELMTAEKMRDGVREYLAKARSQGLKIGMASSSSRQWVEHFIEKLNIAHYFDCIRTGSDVARVKPHPELYLQTLQCLEVDAKEAVAIEDSPNGSKAAMTAGIYCVTVPSLVTKGLDFEPVNCRLNSLTDLDFDLLVQQGSRS